MPSFEQISETYFLSFLIILFRTTAFFYTAPIFGGSTVPAQVKIGLGSFLAAIILLIHGPVVIQFPGSIPSLLVLIAAEVALGLTLGYAVSLVFAGVQIGGMLMGYQMGFAVANVLDPVSNDQVSIIGQFLFLFAILFFLTMNAHHILILGMIDSYDLAPVGSFSVSQQNVSLLVQIFSRMFWLGLKISMPVVGAIFLVDVALGIVAKTIPQMNVFIVGLPLKSLLGMLILALSFPFFSVVMRFDFMKVMDGFYSLMRSL